jgi:tetratricopeptide (TPR) repeat protein
LSKKSKPPKRYSLIANALVCALVWVAAPQNVLGQAGTTASQKKESAEGDRLFNAGVKAYEKGLISEAARLWEQARAVYAREMGEDHLDTVTSMNNLAVSYSALGQLEKSLALNEQTLKLMRSKLGEDHIETLQTMHNLAAIFNALGRHDKASALHEQTLKLRRARLGEDHPDTLTSMQHLASTYRVLGQYDKALILNEQTLRLRRAKLGEDDPNTFFSMGNLANTYNDLGQYDKALELSEQTLKRMRAKLGEDHPETLSQMSNLATIYRNLGQNDRALTLNEQTLKVRRAKLGEDHPDTLMSMNNLLATYLVLGQYDKALVLNEQTLRLGRAKLGEDHPETLASMANLAATYSALGQYDKALVLKEQTLKLMRAKLRADHPDTLSSMDALAVTYRALGQYNKALALNEQVMKLRRAKLGEDHPRTLSSMGNMAVTYSDVGQYDNALALHEQTLKLRRAKLGEDHPDTLNSMGNLAVTYRALGQNDKALALREQTLELSRAKLGEDHPDTLTSMANLVNSYMVLGQHNKALERIPLIATGSEKLRSLPGLTTEQRQSLFARYSDDYQDYAKFYCTALRLGDGFNLGDLSKARTLTDSIKAQSALRSLPIAEQQKLQASAARAQQIQIQIDKLNTEGTRDSSAVLALQKQLDTQNASYLQLVANLNSRFPKYAQLTSLKPATAVQAKQLLGSGDVFVSYLLHTKGDAQAFVLDASGEPRWVDLGKINNHAKSVAAIREILSPSTRQSGQGRLVALTDGGYQWLQPGQDAPKDATPAASNATEALKQLNRYWHNTLIKPILPLAGSNPRWIISPDKDLALLPFDTLPETINEAGESGKSLGQTRNLTLVQSFAVYALLKQREADYAKLQRPKELFAMGNAVYGEGWSDNRGVKRGGGERGYTSRNASVIEDASPVAATPLKPTVEQYSIDQLLWKNLPGTAREVNAVSAVFNTNAKDGAGGADSYFGKDASEGKLQQLNEAGKLKDYRYLLFSAHGYLAQNPALSSLVLSLQGNPPGIDGYVTASEWPLYDVKSDLTVLSACDTGVGKTQAGESVMGLPYALFVAGNKNTLLSLWPVDDDATAEFMKRFFSKLKAGAKQPDALTETKREFMKHPQWNAPKYWAAFVLYGV